MIRVAFGLALAIMLAGFSAPAVADGMRREPFYSSEPGAGAGVEPFYRSYCPADLATYGGCPVRVYSGSYGSFWSAPSPLIPATPAPRRGMVRKD